MRGVGIGAAVLALLIPNIAGAQQVRWAFSWAAGSLFRPGRTTRMSMTAGMDSSALPSSHAGARPAFRSSSTAARPTSAGTSSTPSQRPRARPGSGRLRSTALPPCFGRDVSRLMSSGEPGITAGRSSSMAGRPRSWSPTRGGAARTSLRDRCSARTPRTALASTWEAGSRTRLRKAEPSSSRHGITMRFPIRWTARSCPS